MESKSHNKLIRKKRIKAKFSKNILPRLSVFRSNKHIYAQIVDDLKSATIISASDSDVKNKTAGKKMDIAAEVGKIIAEKAKEKKVEKIVFDRSGYKYHGQIKTLAESARKNGLIF